MKDSFIRDVLLSIFDVEKYKKNAFFINKLTYSYGDLISLTGQILSVVQGIDSDLICLYATDDIRTYASILALWACGKAYVPLNPQQPVERHREVANSVSANYVLSPSPTYDIGLEEVRVLDISGVKPVSEYLPIDIKSVGDDALAYIIFTSGSTGEPKGVQISRGNLSSFIDSMENIGLVITSEDRCLQPFDLTFDFSVSSFLVPLVKGACVYTVPGKSIRYLYIAGLIEEHRLSILQMVPSMMRNLLPYREELDLSSVRYNIFCGESLLSSAIEDWHKSNPSMVTYNMYGPTEDTVFCTYYLIDQNTINVIDSLNDVVSIGIPFKNCQPIITDETGCTITEYGKEGELCLSGAQLTPGYWDNRIENTEKFFIMGGVKYYKTGDICCWGRHSVLMYIGRKDFQVKINGYRVELGEIEKVFYDASGGKYCVALPFVNKQGNTELALVIEGSEYDYSKDKDYMSSHLPKYEVPSVWKFTRVIPLNQNGKVDRNSLKGLIGV